MTIITQREVNHKAKAKHLAALVSDSRRVMMILLGDYWVAEVLRNGFGIASLEIRIKLSKKLQSMQSMKCNRLSQRVIHPRNNVK